MAGERRGRDGGPDEVGEEKCLGGHLGGDAPRLLAALSAGRVGQTTLRVAGFLDFVLALEILCQRRARAGDRHDRAALADALVDVPGAGFHLGPLRVELIGRPHVQDGAVDVIEAGTLGQFHLTVGIDVAGTGAGDGSAAMDTPGRGRGRDSSLFAATERTRYNSRKVSKSQPGDGQLFTNSWA